MSARCARRSRISSKPNVSGPVSDVKVSPTIGMLPVGLGEEDVVDEQAGGQLEVAEHHVGRGDGDVLDGDEYALQFSCSGPPVATSAAVTILGAGTGAVGDDDLGRVGDLDLRVLVVLVVHALDVDHVARLDGDGLGADVDVDARVLAAHRVLNKGRPS